MNIRDLRKLHEFFPSGAESFDALHKRAAAFGVADSAFDSRHSIMMHDARNTIQSVSCSMSRVSC